MFFSYFHSYDIVPWKCNTLHLKAYKAKYPLTLDFMNFEWLSKTSVCLFSSCRFLLSSDAAFLRLSIWQKNERIYYWWYWNQDENIGKMVLLNKVTFNLCFFFCIHWVTSRFDTSCFDTNSSSETALKFRLLQV